MGLFSKRKIILYVSSDKIQVATLDSGHDSKPYLLETYNLTPHNLPQVLKKIQKKFGRQIYVLIDEELVYLGLNQVSIKLSTKEEIRENLSEIIPKEVDDNSWNFQELEIEEKTEKSKTKTIQVFSPNNEFFKHFVSAINATGFDVLSVETVSSSLSRILKDEKEPVIIIYGVDLFLHVVCFKSLVIVSKVLKSVLSAQDLKELILFSTKKFGVAPQKIVLTGQTEKIDKTDLEKAGILIETKNLDPFISLVEKQDLGENGKFSNIKVPGIKTMNNSQFPIPKSHDEKDEKKEAGGIRGIGEISEIVHGQKGKFMRLIGVLILIIVLFTGIFVIQNNSSNKQKDEQVKNQITPTKAPTLTPTPTVVLKDYSLQVLNGTETTGAAGKLGDSLKASGFTVENTGNADRQDYKQTMIQRKKAVPEGFVAILKKKIAATYSATIGFDLKSDDKFDVVLTIGTK